MAKEREVERDELADILGVDVRTITNYIKKPDFPSRVRGNRRTFPVRRCVQWKIDHDVADAIASMAPPKPSHDAELRKMAADAELAEIKVQKARGEVVPVADAIKEVKQSYSRVRARFASIPGEYGPRLLNLTSIPEVTRQLREMIGSVMVELQTDGSAFTEEEDDEPDPAGKEE